MIPKILHYIWLGNNKKPKSFYKCVLSSWQNYASIESGWILKEWNESNIGEFELPELFFNLLKEKRYAFASDILRFYILEKYGGVYFDIDQVLVNSIEDLLSEEMFISKYHEVEDYYGFGLIGVLANHIFARKIIKFYEDLSEVDTKERKERVFVIVNKVGSDIINQNKIEKEFNVRVLEQEYFYPLTKKDFTKSTRSYHLANTSWIPLYKKILYKVPFYSNIKFLFKKTLPKFISKRIFNTRYL